MPNTGLYGNLVPSGSAPPTGGTGLPDVGTLVNIRNTIWSKVIPAGRLRTAMMSMDGSLLGVFQTIISLIKGRKYSQGEYEVGKMLINKLRCTDKISWQQVPDDLVPIAKKILTQLFGVRIMNSADLGRLTQSADAYYNNNANRKDQPLAAVNRAVMLAKNYFNPYNDDCVDIRIFDQYPLVAPIPAMDSDDENSLRGKFFTGVGLNGQQFQNGLLAPGTFSTSGLTSNLQASVSGISTASLQKYAPFIALLLVIGVIISIKLKLYKP